MAFQRCKQVCNALTALEKVDGNLAKDTKLLSFRGETLILV
jgi:hypothetical protein